MTAPPLERPSEIAALRRDLTALRQRGFHNLEDRRKPVDFEQLELLAREYTADQPDLNRREAIRILILAAIPKIEDAFKIKAGEHRDRIERSFGLTPGLEHITSPAELWDAAVVARQGESKYQPDSIREYYRLARYALADAIYKFIEDIRVARQLIQTSPYVEREGLNRKFRLATEDQALAVVCFTGSRGTGKSRLVKHLASKTYRARRRDVLELDAADEATLYRTISRELAYRGVHVVGRSADEIARDVVGYLSDGRNGQPVVILDDVDSWEVVHPIVSGVPGVLFLVTSSNGDLRIPVPHILIDVEPMTLPEASELARRLVRSERASDADCSLLATELGYLPLAIEHAASLINDGWMSVADFVEQLRMDASGALSPRSKDQPDRSLSLIYVEIINRLARECPDAGALLELIAQIHPERIPLDLISEAHAIFRKQRTDLPHLSQGYAVGLGVSELRRLRILQYAHDEWSIHRLTHRLLAEQFGLWEGKDAALAVTAAFANLTTDVLVGASLGGVARTASEHAERAFNRIQTFSQADRLRGRLGRVVLILGKWDWLRGFGSFQKHRINACRRRMAQAGLAEGEADIRDLDLLELHYAVAKSEYDSGGAADVFARSISDIAAAGRSIVKESDHEHQVWVRFLEIESRLLQGDPSHPIDVAMDAMALIKATHEAPSSWHGEAFLKIAEIEARRAMWRNAAGLYGYAGNQFRKSMDSASNVCGLAHAYAGTILTTMMFESPARWGAISAHNELMENEQHLWESDESDILARPPLLSLESVQRVSAAVDHLAATEVIKYLAFQGVTEKRGADFASLDEWCMRQLRMFRVRQPASVFQSIGHIRVEAARDRKFADSVLLVDVLLEKSLQGADLATALRLLILKDKLYALLASKGMPLDLAIEALARMGSVASHAGSLGWLHICQEAAITAHFIVLITDASDSERAALLPVMDESGNVAITAERTEIYPERNASPLGWYELVLAGDVAPIGILAY